MRPFNGLIFFITKTKISFICFQNSVAKDLKRVGDNIPYLLLFEIH